MFAKYLASFPEIIRFNPSTSTPMPTLIPSVGVGKSFEEDENRMVRSARAPAPSVRVNRCRGAEARCARRYFGHRFGRITDISSGTESDWLIARERKSINADQARHPSARDAKLFREICSSVTEYRSAMPLSWQLSWPQRSGIFLSGCAPPNELVAIELFWRPRRDPPV